MRQRAKKDINQNHIVADLKGFGFSVQELHQVGGGFPDILVGTWGINFLYELKSTKHDWMTTDETEWHLLWKGHHPVCKTTEQILEDMIAFVKENLREGLVEKIVPILESYIRQLELRK